MGYLLKKYLSPACLSCAQFFFVTSSNCRHQLRGYKGMRLVQKFPLTFLFPWDPAPILVPLASWWPLALLLLCPPPNVHFSSTGSSCTFSCVPLALVPFSYFPLNLCSFPYNVLSPASTSFTSLPFFHQTFIEHLLCARSSSWF